MTDSPGARVPAVRLARSQGASDQSRQSTGLPPNALRVSRVVPPWVAAETVRRPGAPGPAASGVAGAPELMTSTETSGAALPGAKPGSPVVRAVLPVFSYAVSGRPSVSGGGICDSLEEMRVPSPTGSPMAGAPR
ncbi:hypothetical protein [Streptomyces sp. NPDC089915]|uniref:hypothetical protein n=1 Tax=Streptomyces sp. NPDC089915 TaxID=3155186 RepID=UPI00342EA72D